MALIPEIKAQQSVELLKALHILTRDGKINQDSRRKLKQVYHLYQFIEPLMLNVLEQQKQLTLVDHGAGKSYLGFILYDLLLKEYEQAHVYGIEFREQLVKSSEALAEKLGFSEGMSFKAMRVEEAMTSTDIPAKVDITTALHACDTATDDAIRFALERQSNYIVLVPCCQAEVAAHMRQKKQAALKKSSLAEIWRHPIHTR